MEYATPWSRWMRLFHSKDQISESSRRYHLSFRQRSLALGYGYGFNMPNASRTWGCCILVHVLDVRYATVVCFFRNGNERTVVLFETEPPPSVGLLVKFKIVSRRERMRENDFEFESMSVAWEMLRLCSVLKTEYGRSRGLSMGDSSMQQPAVWRPLSVFNYLL